MHFSPQLSLPISVTTALINGEKKRPENGAAVLFFSGMTENSLN